jgi:hypothetical protein
MADKEVINPPLMNADQACAYLGGICRRSLANLEYRGELTSIPILGRRMFRRSDLDRLARMGTRNASRAKATAVSR